MPTIDDRPSRSRRVALGVVVLLAIAAVGAYLLQCGTTRDRDGDEVPAGSPSATAPAPRQSAGLSSKPATAPAKASDETPAPKPRAKRVCGHVLDIDGKPLAGAPVRWEVIVEADGTGTLTEYQLPSAPVLTGADGAFEIDVPPSKTTRRDIAVRATGFGLVTAEVDLASPPADVVLRLAGDAIRGIATTEDGTPVPNVTLRFGRRWAAAAENRGRGHDQADGIFRISPAFESQPFGRSQNEREVADVATDAGGRFAVQGMGRDSVEVIDCDWAWMVVPGDFLHPSKEAHVRLIPAACAAIHVRSAGEDAPVSPKSLMVELWTGAGTGAAGVGPDFAVRWPMSRAEDGGSARVKIEADGYYTETVVARVPKGERRTDTTVRMRPVPKGPPGSLRVRVQTADPAFRTQGFQLELREHAPDGIGETIDEDQDNQTPDELPPRDEVFAWIEGRVVGDDVLFDGLPPGRWHVTVRGHQAMRSLGFAATMSIVPSTESVATWTVPPHGWIRFVRTTKQEGDIVFHSALENSWMLGSTVDQRYAVAPGAWTVSWRPKSDEADHDFTVLIEAGKDATVTEGSDVKPGR